MKFLAKLTIRTKIALGFLVVLVVVLIALAFGIIRLAEGSENLERSVAMAEEVEKANMVKNKLDESVLAFRDYITSNESAKISIYKSSMTDLKDSVSALQIAVDDDTRLSFVSAISNDVRELDAAYSEIISLNEDINQRYVVLAAMGYEMLDDLQLVSRHAALQKENELLLMAGDASNQLLYARLHATKYFFRHEDSEYTSYQERYKRYRENISSIGLDYNVQLFKEAYIRLHNNANDYFDGMSKVNDNVTAMNQYFDIIDQRVPHIVDMANVIVETASSDMNQINTTGIRNNNLSITWMLALSTLAIFIMVLVIFRIVGMVTEPFNYLSNAFYELAESEANTSYRLAEQANDEIGLMARNFNKFMARLGIVFNEMRLSNYIKTASNDMNKLIQVEEESRLVADRLLTYVTNYCEGVLGSFYFRQDDCFLLMSSHGHLVSEELTVDMESYLGTLASRKSVTVIKDLKEQDFYEDNIAIRTSLMDKDLISMVVIPTLHDGEINGLIELALLREPSAMDMEFFDAMSISLGGLLHTVHVRQQMKELLNQTMHQAEEMQMQQEELKQSNEELEEQTRALKDSESRLMAQQEELRVTNEELEERSRQLEMQKNELDVKNKAILLSQEEIMAKATELEETNRYKSEFLANMSHELRTPLNSILVLSQLLEKRNNASPLSPKEVEFATTINKSGNDLLTLINGVLDLSKVEAGRLDLHLESFSLQAIIGDLVGLFEPLTDIKHIDLKVDNQLGESFEFLSDSLRLNQILKNLLSNAIKFTDEGHVKLTVRKPNPYETGKFGRQLSKDVVFEVSDTGIGIEKEKQAMIFEAFKQSDGSTSRDYGGTGLGLTISLELARLMHGDIYIESEPGQGSRFIFMTPSDIHDYIKEDHNDPEARKMAEEIINREAVEFITNQKVDIQSMDAKEESISDDSVSQGNVSDPEVDHGDVPAVERVEKSPQANRLLIVEDDVNFATVLKSLAEEKGYEVILSHSGLDALRKAKDLNPDGIILDMGLPDIDGMEVVRKLGDQPATANIPIHIVSGRDAEEHQDMPKSIIGFLKKPVDIKSIYSTLSKIEEYSNEGLKRLLVVGECGDEDFEYFQNLGNVAIKKVSTGAMALEEIQSVTYGCIVLDAKLADMSGVAFINQINDISQSKIPVIIYTDDPNTEDMDDMEKMTESVVLKSPKSKERLTDEVNLFLHDMSRSVQKYVIESHITREVVKANVKEHITHEDSLSGVKVLLADDDERNIFALTHALEHYGMVLDIADNGHRAVQCFESRRPDIVLMDIMMPEMDGYDAIRNIRKIEEKGRVPIIALTAKAMKDDREKCIEAGADDYMTKPVDIDKLVSLIKVWLA